MGERAEQFHFKIIQSPGNQRQPPWWVGLLRTSSWPVSSYKTGLLESPILIITETNKPTSRGATVRETQQMELQMKTSSDILQQTLLDKIWNILPGTFLVTTKQRVGLKTDIECLTDTGKKLSFVCFLIIFILKCKLQPFEQMFSRKDYSGSLPDFSYLFTNTIELSFGTINLLDWLRPKLYIIYL